MTDQEIIELRQRNAQRLEEAKKKLGSRWLLHPDNKATKEKWQEIVQKTKPQSA